MLFTLISSGRLAFLQCFYAISFANNGQLIVGGNPTETQFLNNIFCLTRQNVDLNFTDVIGFG